MTLVHCLVIWGVSFPELKVQSSNDLVIRNCFSRTACPAVNANRKNCTSVQGCAAGGLLCVVSGTEFIMLAIFQAPLRGLLDHSLSYFSICLV